MKNVTKKLFLSTLLATTLVLSTSANANGTKKPPSHSLLEYNTSVLITDSAD